MRVRDLLSRLEDRPFKPFRAHVSDGSVLDVLEPWSMALGRFSAIMASRFERDDEGRRVAVRWRTVGLDQITQLSDLDESRDGRGRRRRGR